jgi:hypothetical protein
MLQMTNYFMKHAFKSPYPSLNFKHTTTETENKTKYVS